MPENDSNADAARERAHSRDEVAVELMKFIAVTTGYGKSPQASAGFSGKPSAHSPEEHAEALLELFERCRAVLKKEP
jgi:hypothetical protein